MLVGKINAYFKVSLIFAKALALVHHAAARSRETADFFDHFKLLFWNETVLLQKLQTLIKMCLNLAIFLAGILAGAAARAFKIKAPYFPQNFNIFLRNQAVLFQKSNALIEVGIHFAVSVALLLALAAAWGFSPGNKPCHFPVLFA